MMALVGAALVLGAAVGCFQSLRLALSAREQELLSWLAAVRLLNREITYGVLPLPRVCGALAEQAGGVAGQFFAAAAERLQAAEDAPVVNLAALWRDLLAEQGAAWHLLAADMAALRDLGAGLGQSNLGGQKKLLALTEERLSQLAAESAARYLRLSRLLSGLGWCCGLLLICLWL